MHLLIKPNLGEYKGNIITDDYRQIEKKKNYLKSKPKRHKMKQQV